MFTRKDKQDLMEQLAQLKGELAKTRAEREAVMQATLLEDEIFRLKQNISDLEAKESSVREKYERERREVEHMVGLERKRQEFETEQARREATVTVKEEALIADRKRFEEQMEFIQGRMSEEVRYLKDDIIKAIIKLVPKVEVDRVIREDRSG